MIERTLPPIGQEHWIPASKRTYTPTLTIPVIESGPVAVKPKNYLALQSAYQELVPVGSTKEISAIYLTDQKDRIVLAYAACGDETSVVMPAAQDELEYFFRAYRLDTIATFHNHPESYVTSFSEPDITTWMAYNRFHLENIASLQSNIGRTLFLFDAVATCTDEYEWAGHSAQLVENRTIDFSPKITAEHLTLPVKDMSKISKIEFEILKENKNASLLTQFRRAVLHCRTSTAS